MFAQVVLDLLYLENSGVHINIDYKSQLLVVVVIWLLGIGGVVTRGRVVHVRYVVVVVVGRGCRVVLLLGGRRVVALGGPYVLTRRVVGRTRPTGGLGFDGLAQNVGHGPLGDAKAYLRGVDVVVAEVSIGGYLEYIPETALVVVEVEVLAVLVEGDFVVALAGGGVIGVVLV